MTIMFGEDVSDTMHSYINEDGVVTKVSLQYALRAVMLRLVNKGANPVRVWTSRFDSCCLNASERYNRQNCEVIKDYVRDYVKKRKTNLNKS